MGIFSRSSQTDVENESFDDEDLPSSTDINDSALSAEEAPLDFNLGQQPKSRAVKKLAYGIEEAILLMKALPRDNNEVVVTVVKKTLESTNIEVQDIIDDANTREERMRAKQKQLETEIKNLQSEITQRNQRISELVQDLKETSDVRQRLQLALELDTRKEKTEGGKPSQTKAAETAAPGMATATPTRPGAGTTASNPVKSSGGNAAPSSQDASAGRVYPTKPSS